MDKKGSEESDDAAKVLLDSMGIDDVEAQGKPYGGGEDIPSSVYKKSISMNVFERCCSLLLWMHAELHVNEE